MYYIYILRCEDNSLYTGITTDVKRRMNEHFTRNEKCAKYTSSHQARNLECVYEALDRASASKLEYNIKRLSKIKKEHLIISNDLSLIFKEKLDVNKYRKINNLEEYVNNI